MTSLTWVLLVGAALAAVVNWIGVSHAPAPSPAAVRGSDSRPSRPAQGSGVRSDPAGPTTASPPRIDPRTLVYVGKPAALLLLIGVALSLDPADGTLRAWIVAGLVLSLVGDIALMLPRDLFIVGLGAFFAGHVAYVIGMILDHRSWPLTAVGVVVVAAALAAVAPRIVGAVGRRDPALRAPVVAYMGVISVMVVSAFGRTVALGLAGAVLFYASDTTLAWNRFVTEVRRGDLAVMITYHLAQAALVLSLLS